MDVILKLSRPEGYTEAQGARVTVTFDKSRSFYGAAAEPFCARLDESGWLVEGPAGFGVPSRAVERRNAVMDYVRGNPGCSKRDVTQNVKGRDVDLRKVLDELNEDGSVVKRDGTFYAA